MPVLRALGATLLLACAGPHPSPTSPPAPARATAAPTERSAARTAAVPGVPDLTDLAARVARGVVSLDASERSSAPDGASRSSSGVLVSERGDVLTNAHGVRGVDRLDAIAHDGRLLVANVVATDESTDLALLRLSGDLSGLEPVSWATADPEPGSAVVAVGNALGAGLAVSSGLVSAIGRSDLGHARYEDYILTDARIVRGISGGALVDLSGHLVGIALGALDDGQTGGLLGLAVSRRLAFPVAAQLATSGVVERGHLGLELDALDAEAARRLGTSTARGAIVKSVELGSPAEQCGLRPGDVIVEANGWPIRTRGNARAALSTVASGRTAALTVLREGQQMSLQITAGRAPPSSRTPSPALSGATTRPPP